MPISNNVLGTTATNIFTSATATGDVVSVMYFCNRTASPVTFDLHIVPDGQTLSADNIVYSDKSIAANDTYVVDLEKILLSPGDSLQAVCSVANAVVATVSTLGV